MHIIQSYVFLFYLEYNSNGKEGLSFESIFSMFRELVQFKSTDSESLT